MRTFFPNVKFSLGMGQNGDTVVVANVCLDSQCMRVASFAYLQKKSEQVINKFTMRDIILGSWERYCADNEAEYHDPSPRR